MQSFRYQKGVTLIELVIFILIISIGLAAVTVVMTTVLTRAPLMQQTSEALSLAQGRMEIILGWRYLFGYQNLVDPCLSVSPPAMCSNTLPGYTVTSLITPISINGDANYKRVTVTVVGTTTSARSVLSSVVAAYG